MRNVNTLSSNDQTEELSKDGRANEFANHGIGVGMCPM